MIDKNVQQLM